METPPTAVLAAEQLNGNAIVERGYDARCPLCREEVMEARERHGLDVTTDAK